MISERRVLTGGNEITKRTAMGIVQPNGRLERRRVSVAVFTAFGSTSPLEGVADKSGIPRARSAHELASARASTGSQ